MIGHVSDPVQDQWAEAAQVFYNNCLRLLLEPKQTPEQLHCLLNMMREARVFHVESLAMEAEVEAIRAKFAHAAECQHG